MNYLQSGSKHNIIFFLVKMDFIEILESNVEDVSNVTIIEERLKDGSEIFFNDQQIKSHLTSLLYANNVNTNILAKKVDDYYSLFQNVNKDTDVNPLLPPIIDAKQIVHYVNEDEYVADEEFEDNEQIKMVYFDDFLKQFHVLNRDVNNRYKATASKLYSLFKPFDSKGKTVQYNSDAFDLKKRKYRLLGKQRDDIYNGDEINIIGYGHPNASKVIDFDKYLEECATLNGNVKVVFNDFAYDGNKLITTLKGTVKQGTIKLDKPIKFRGILTQTLNINNDDYFVFSNGADSFSKQTFVHDYVKIICKQPQTILLPSNASQALFAERDNIVSFSHIPVALEKYGFAVDELPEYTRLYIDKLCSKTLPKRDKAPSIKTLQPPSESTVKLLKQFPGNNNLTRYANYKYASGVYDILKTYQEISKNTTKSNVKQYIEGLRVKLSKLPDESKKSPECKTIQKTISKEYKSLKDLYNDDGKECYWDANLDPTDYSLKKDYKTVTELEKYFIANNYQNNIRFEAKAVISGKRRVREGEHAILKTNDSTLVFTRKVIAGNEKWVKSLTVDGCIDTIAHWPDILNSCYSDSFEKTCDSLKNIQLARQRNTLATAITILETCVKTDTPPLEYFKTTILKPSRNAPFKGFHYQVSHQDLEGNDIEETFADLMNNIEASDFGHYVLTNRSEKEDTKLQTDDIITILTKYLDIGFSKAHRDYYDNKLKGKFDTAQIDTELLQKRDELMSKVNKELYESNLDFKKKVDAKIEDKLQTMFIGKYNQVHYERLCYSLGLLTCLLMCLYPNVSIGRVIPKCSSTYSHIGYPVTQNSKRSLEAYLICVTKFLAVPDDVRYQVFNDKSTDEIILDVHTAITSILESDYPLSQTLDMNKIALNKKKNDAKEITSEMLRPSFKPNFNFVATPKTNTLKFLKSVAEHFAKEKYTKTNFQKAVFIANSCCPERLTNDIDFYKPLLKDQSIQQYYKKFDNANKVSWNVYVPRKKTVSKTAFTMPNMSQKHVKNIHDNCEKQEEQNDIIDYSDDAQFDNIILPRVEKAYQKLIDKIKKTLDNINIDILAILRQMLVQGLHNDIKQLRNALYGFLKNKLPLIMGRIKHGYKYSFADEEDALYRLLKELSGISSAVIEDVSFGPIIFLENSNDEGVYIKNIALMMDQLLTYLDNVCKSSTVISAKISYTVMLKLHEYIDSTVFDIDSVVKGVEELREKRKQDQMNAYKVDDEERSLQIQLRDMGVQNWENVFDRLKNVDINAHHNDQEENENYRMNDYQGENADEDIDEDYDIVRGEGPSSDNP